MSEILFRGKRRDNGEWVVGYVMIHDNDKATIFRQHQGDGGLEGFEVDPETVGQYAGLTDKNGKKIYEGDIISGPGNIPWLVDFERNAFVAKDDEMELYFALFEQWEYDYKNKKHISPSNKFEVIGNIHDNPELLKVGGGDA